MVHFKWSQPEVWKKFGIAQRDLLWVFFLGEHQKFCDFQYATQTDAPPRRRVGEDKSSVPHASHTRSLSAHNVKASRGKISKRKSTWTAQRFSDKWSKDRRSQGDIVYPYPLPILVLCDVLYNVGHVRFWGEPSGVKKEDEG